MKHTLNILFLIMIILSCNRQKCNNQELKNKVVWTEDQKWQYFQDSIANRRYYGTYGEGDSLNNFIIFSKVMFQNIKAKNIQDPLIYAFEESYIDTTKIEKNRIWLRITIDPTFRKPYCLILEQKRNKSYLTAKMTNGHGGYTSGVLDFSTSKVYSDSLINEIFNTLRKIDFWKLEEDTTGHLGFDGDGWTIEAIENGKYNIINRWEATDCGNNATRELGQIGLKLRDMSNILDLFAIKYKIKREDLTSY